MTLRGRAAKATASCDLHPSASSHDHCPTCGEPRWEDSTHACPPGFAAATPGPPSEAMAAVQAILDMDRHHNDYQEEPRRWKRLVEAIRALEARVAELEAVGRNLLAYAEERIDGILPNPDMM